MVIDMSEKDYVCANLLLESCFDTTLSQNIDDLEAVRSYFLNKDSLQDFYGYYAGKLEAMRQDDRVNIDMVRSFVQKMFKEIEDKLLFGCKVPNLNLAPIISGSLLAVNDSKLHAPSEFSNGGVTQKSPGRALNVEIHSLRDANLSDFEVASLSKGWTSAHYSPIISPKIDMAMTSKKKGKSRFNELAQEARVRAFHQEWPLFHKSNGGQLLTDNSPNRPEMDVSPLNFNRSPTNNKKPSDIYQDNSPSMISLITKDDKKVIKDRVINFDVLMKSAWYLKCYLRNVPLKKQEIYSVIESFYFEDNDLLEAIGEHRQERNNTKTLHKIQELLELKARESKRSPKKVHFNCTQTIEFLGYFDIVCKEWVPLLRTTYENYDNRLYSMWIDFSKRKNIVEFGLNLTQLANTISEEKKALSKKVVLS